MWQHQMLSRCPNVKYLGVGRLRHWRWQINTQGVANMVEAPLVPYSPGMQKWLGPLSSAEDAREDNDRTYGFVYQLSPEDEEKLDQFEDIAGGSYTKEYVYVEFWMKGGDGKTIDIGQRFRRARALVYVDRTRTQDGKANGSYTYKMNEAIQDALGEGIPPAYIKDCIRPYIPVVNKRESISAAIEEAMRNGVDVKKMIEETEVRMATQGAKEEGKADGAIPQDILTKYVQNTSARENGAASIQTSESLEEASLKRRRALTLAW